MKQVFVFTRAIMVGTLFLMMASCASFQGMNLSVTTNAPQFTTVDKVLKLAPGMHYDEVVSILDCPAYDVYTLNYEDFQTIYIWYYKKIERKVDPNLLNSRDGAKIGDEVLTYQDILYCTFDVNKKLVKIVTDPFRNKFLKLPDNLGNKNSSSVEKRNLLLY